MGNALEETHVIGINSLPFDLSSLGHTFEAAAILLTTKQKGNPKDSVSVVYCCVQIIQDLVTQNVPFICSQFYLEG